MIFEAIRKIQSITEHPHPDTSFSLEFLRARLRISMHPGLLQLLEQNRVSVPWDLLMGVGRVAGLEIDNCDVTHNSFPRHF